MALRFSRPVEIGSRLGASSDAGSRLGCFGRLFVSLFFLAFLAAGLFFSGAVLMSFRDALAMRSWPSVPCTIVESRTGPGESSEAYQFFVRYRYVWNGRELIGDRYKAGYGGGDDVSAAERLAMRYPIGAEATCRVDPAQPERSALELSSLAVGFVVLFPLVFVGIGGGGLAFMLWGLRRGGKVAGGAAAGAAASPAISAAATGGKATVWLAGFFSIFLLVGLVMSYFLLWRPLSALAAARSWSALPCVVEASEVRSHEGDDSTTYSVDIRYRYEVGGRPFRSNRYDFLGGSSSGYESKQRIVDAHPPGAVVTCYVDPADAASAVLDRGWGPRYLLGLLPLLFVAVGGGGMTWALSSGRRAAGAVPGTHLPAASSGGSVSPASAPTAHAVAGQSGPTRLVPKQGPVAKILGILFVALFWNGITGVFVWQAVLGWRAGSGDLFLTLFITPFVLIGLGLIGAIPYTILAAANPRPILELSTGAPRLGEIERLDWSFRGSVSRLTRLRILLEGKEEATYRRGTTTSTDRETFHSELLFETPVPGAMARGSLSFAVPADSMHSFAGDHNKVIWTLKVLGEIPRWPDVSEELEISVRPQEPAGEGG